MLVRVHKDRTGKNSTNSFNVSVNLDTAKVEEKSLPKCCRWCKDCVFKDHSYICTNSSNTISSDVGDSIYSVSESGLLSEVLEESVKDVNYKDFKDLEDLLREYKVSEKRIKEFNEVFSKCMEDYHVNLVETLDEKVSICYQNFIAENYSSNDQMIIEDPENFVCNNWR